VRRGSVATARALAEQSTAATEVTVEAQSLTKMIASLTGAMNEQAAAMGQITEATDAIRRQTDQTNQGLAEQARAAAALASVSQNVATQVAIMTRANSQQSSHLATLTQSLSEARRLGQGTTQGARDTTALTQQLVNSARSLQPGPS